MRPPAVSRLTWLIARLGRRLLDAVDREDAFGRGIAHHVKPAPAAVRMHPALAVMPFGIGAHEQVIRPCRIVERAWIRGHRDMRLSAVGELDLVARPAPGASDAE